MRVYGIFIFFVLFTIIVPDIYIYIRFIYKRIQKSLAILHWVISLYFTVVTITILLNINTIISPETTLHFMTFVASLGMIYIPKLLFISFDLVFFLTKKRWRWIQYIGYFFSITALVLIFYAICWGRFNFNKREFIIEIDDLPAQFEGYKIAHISDLHLGSFSLSRNKLINFLDQINNENPDIIVFTGDMVNNFAVELEGWSEPFGNLKAKDGKLAILGNHDYSMYYSWLSDKDKDANQNSIINGIKNLDFTLLLNESFNVKKDSSTITFVGMENWGHHPFPQRSNLKEALRNTDNNNLVILLSHDPNYWQDSIVHKTAIPLTLSGHTHGAQIGIDAGGIKFSPAQLRSKYWDGLNTVNNQHLIITRGVGCAGVPARLFMDPEFIIITLKKKN